LRDILTVIAALLILVLAAALVAPPFINWEAHRQEIDEAISAASGTEARTDGPISVRLLPSPRLQVGALRLGAGRPDSPRLEAEGVVAEVELLGLLRGEVHFTEARIGRADIRIPLDGAGSWQIPADLVSGEGRRRQWGIDNLRVDQLLVTSLVPTTGRTDQFYAEDVHIEGQQLIGPWRAEGTSVGVPFRVATGAFGADRTIDVKIAGGGDVYPRFDVDAKLAFAATGLPAVTGTAKVLFGPPAQVAAAGIPIPVSVQAGFKTAGQAVELENVTVEAGEGGASVRLTGWGVIRTNDPRVSLTLEGRRLDADSFILSGSGRDFIGRLNTWALPPINVPVDLSLSLASIGLAQDELRDFVFRGSALPGKAQIEEASFVAPGETRVALSGEVGLTTQGGGAGRVSLTSASSDRLARYVEQLGLRSPFLRALDGRPFEVSSDVTYAAPVMSLRNLRLKAGDALLTGQARYTAPEGDSRGRLEAQVAAQNVDVGQLPRVASIFEATRNLDVGFTLDARDVRYGGPQRSAGRITARIASDGPALLVETLNITDLAGANVRVSGRIAPDGSGRIAGKVTAQRAAPLVDLIGTVWVGGVSKLVPHFLREGDLDLDVVTERPAPTANAQELRLRTSVKGRAAGGGFEAEVLTVDGATQNLAVRLATDNTGRWVDRPNVPLLRRPSSVELKGVRVGSGQVNATIAGDIGGLRVSTTRPFALSPNDEIVDSGEAEIATADITPFLVLLGDGAGVEPPVPAQARISLGRERDASLLTIAGQVAGDAVQARLAVRSRAEVSGSVTLDRLSMPWLVTALALNAPADPRATSLWSSVRFGQTGRLVSGGQATFKAARLDLGRGLEATDAGFTLVVNPDGLIVRDFDAALAGGRLTGATTVTRQGALASVVGEGALREASLGTLAGPTPIEAQLSMNLRFGASAETFAGLVANLGGAGEVRLTNLQVPNADPAAISRALPRILAEEDPLAPRRLETVMSEELSKGPLRAATVASQATIVAGALRLSPFAADAGAATWQGVVSFDARNLGLEARGTMTAKGNVRGWTGTAPFIGVNWRGPLRALMREVDTGPLTNGLAGIVLQRELEKIEAFEVEGNERQRRSNRREMDRQREVDRLAAEEAARQARIREEQERARLEAEQRRAQEEARLRAEEEARQARIREEQERARLEAERRRAEELARQRAEEEARQARLRAEEEARRRAEEERLARLRAEEEARQARLREEAEQRARAEEAARLVREREAVERARIEAERRAQEEAARAARAEAERRQREEADRRAREEAERRAAEGPRPEPSLLSPMPLQLIPQPLDIRPRPQQLNPGG
jgi:uncharacterized protein involved in outer membrane biogenesis